MAEDDHEILWGAGAVYAGKNGRSGYLDAEIISMKAGTDTVRVRDIALICYSRVKPSL